MMHSALTFELLNDHEVLDHLATDQWVTLRRIVTELILATDMMKHFELVEKFVSKYGSRSLPMASFEDKVALYKMCMKGADIAHAGKTEELHNKWSLKVVEEFFHQGDMEREQHLPISMFCDRHSVELPTSQCDFICKIVKPLFLAINSVVRSSTIQTVIITQLDVNVEFWKKQVQRKKRASVAHSLLPVEQLPRLENSLGKAGTRAVTVENL